MKRREATDTRFMEVKIEYKEKMLHREVDAKEELGPGKGRTILPGDFQKSTGQGPVQPDVPETVALLWAGTSSPS